MDSKNNGFREIMHILNIIDRLEIEIQLSLYKSTMIKGRESVGHDFNKCGGS